MNFSKCFKSQFWNGILICIHHSEFMSGFFWRLESRVMVLQATVQGESANWQAHDQFHTNEVALLCAWLDVRVLHSKFTNKE